MGKFNEYSQKATPADNDTLMIYDATSKANKLSPFSGIWNWIVGKLTNAVISNLETQNKSVVGALNELNSKAFRTIDVSFLKTKMYLYKANNVVTITYTGDTTNNLIPKGDLGIVGVLPKEYIPDTNYIFLNVQINNVKIQLNFYADGNIHAYNYGEQTQTHNSCRYSGAYVVK